MGHPPPASARLAAVRSGRPPKEQQQGRQVPPHDRPVEGGVPALPVGTQHHPAEVRRPGAAAASSPPAVGEGAVELRRQRREAGQEVQAVEPRAPVVPVAVAVARAGGGRRLHGAVEGRPPVRVRRVHESVEEGPAGLRVRPRRGAVRAVRRSLAEARRAVPPSHGPLVFPSVLSLGSPAGLFYWLYPPSVQPSSCDSVRR